MEKVSVPANPGPPARRTTIADVARRAGVSKGAVSFALNGRPGVAASTRERILQAAAELGWQPSMQARGLSHSRAYALGLVVSRPPQLLAADPFFPGFIAGVETVLAARGWSLVLQVVGDREAEDSGYRRLARDGRVDGVFLTDLRHGDCRIGLLRSLALPAVSLGRPDVESPFPAAVLDDSAGITAAVDHLVGLGHRSIAHVAGSDRYIHGRGRREAWERAVRAHGLPPGPWADGGFTAAGGAAATHQLLARPDRPTAIVFASDVMAAAGLTVAHTLGLRVPEDLSVTGYDDIELAAHLHPALTTVRQDAVAWGQAATRTLLALIEDGAADDVELPPARLVTRASTGSPQPPIRVRNRPSRLSGEQS